MVLRFANGIWNYPLSVPDLAEVLEHQDITAVFTAHVSGQNRKILDRMLARHNIELVSA